MVPKKSKKSDLRNKQGLFFQIGILAALAIVFVSFQWSTKKGETPVLSANTNFSYEPELIPITLRDEPKPEAPKPVVEPEKFIITEDPEVIDEAIFKGSEGFDNVPISIIPVAMEPEAEVVDNKIFERVEEMPEFPGGERALLSFISKHIIYPELAKDINVQGKVYLRFVINEKGKVGNIQVIRGVDPILDQEAIRVVGLLPDWKPGKQGIKNVSVYYTLPINFKLN